MLPLKGHISNQTKARSQGLSTQATYVLKCWLQTVWLLHSFYSPLRSDLHDLLHFENKTKHDQNKTNLTKRCAAEGVCLEPLLMCCIFWSWCESTWWVLQAQRLSGRLGCLLMLKSSPLLLGEPPLHQGDPPWHPISNLTCHVSF